MNEYGLRWRVWRKGELQTREKFFANEEQRQRYADKISEQDSFVEFLAWSDPVVTLH